MNEFNDFHENQVVTDSWLGKVLRTSLDMEVARKPLTFCTLEMIEFVENPACI